MKGGRWLKDALFVFLLTEQQWRNLFLAPAHMTGGWREKEQSAAF